MAELELFPVDKTVRKKENSAKIQCYVGKSVMRAPTKYFDHLVEAFSVLKLVANGRDPVVKIEFEWAVKWAYFLRR